MALTLGEYLGGLAKEQRNQRETQGMESGTITSRFILSTHRVKFLTSRVLIESRNIGSYFILGSASNGVLGTNTLSTNMVWGNAGTKWGSAIWGGTQQSFSTVEEITMSQPLTDTGKNLIAQWLGGTSITSPSHFGLGTDSTIFTESDTSLGTEIARSAIDTLDNSIDATITYTGTILSTQSAFQSDTFRELGIFNASSSGTMFGRYIISSLNMINTKDYKFTVDINILDNTVGFALIPTTGLNLLRDILTGNSVTAPTHVAWGAGAFYDSVNNSGLWDNAIWDSNANPLATDTTILDEIQRNIIGNTTVTNNIVSYDTILTSSQANGEDLTKLGIFNASSGGDLFLKLKYGKIDKTNIFQIQSINRVLIL